MGYVKSGEKTLCFDFSPDGCTSLILTAVLALVDPARLVRQAPSGEVFATHIAQRHPLGEECRNEIA